MIYRVNKTDDRRDLDGFVRSVYDQVSDAADVMSRQGYNMLIRGGANALHRFGSIIVPRSAGVHVIELREAVQ